MNKITIEEFGERLATLIPTLMKEMWKYERSFFSAGEITVQQIAALHCLARRGSCAMSTLAQTVSLRESTITGIADRMERTGLIRRTRDRGDRRVVRAAITPKGRATLKALHRHERDGFMALFERVSAAERARFIEILERLVNTLSSDEQAKEMETR